MIKRVFDFCSSLIALIILSPIFLIISIIIVFDSKGPIFYKQTRVGKNNVDFKLYKFRSMYVNADRQGLLTVGERDSRITKIGYWLRKYKIDEIPQLINVLLGEMSIVGPRPEVRKYVELYNDQQVNVLSLKPGITDIASIEYRNENEILSSYDDPEKVYINIIMPRKLYLNSEYAKKHSFFLDIKIILLTIKAVIYKSDYNKTI